MDKAATIDKLNLIYETIEGLSDEIPGELAKKIELYARALQLMGKLEAEAVHLFKQCYAKRKLAEKRKNHDAEYALRMQEADLEHEKVRWHNAYDSTRELIQAMKYSLKVLTDEYNSKTQS